MMDVSYINNDKTKTLILVKHQIINVILVYNKEYISLIDLARYDDEEKTRFSIQNWMRNKDVISYLGLWENIHNDGYNRVEFDTVKNEAGSNKFKISPQRWIRETNAHGIISKSGRYDSGTFAHPDIAFEFSSWLSSEFKLYLIQEFQRLKKNESYRENIEWQANRLLSKLNYMVHTDAIKNNIVPTLTDSQKRFVYAEEWRDNNPTLANEGNIRDYTDLLHLIILSNLENINADEFIK